MARIRSVKPEFFKHYELFQLEQQEQLPIRLAFEGLWLCADKEGRFKWQPHQLKLDVLPYDNVDFEKVLNALWREGYIRKYEFQNKLYGDIPSFKEHQRITGSEAQSESKLPSPHDGNILETSRKQQGAALEDSDNHLGNNESDATNCKSDGIHLEISKKQQGIDKDDRKGKEGKGREKEGKGEGGSVPQGDFEVSIKKNEVDTPLLQIPFSDENFLSQWRDWKNFKAKEHKFYYKTAQSEQAALNELVRLAEGEESTAIEIIHKSIANGWKGFFALKNNIQNGKGQFTNHSGRVAVNIPDGQRKPL